MAGELRIKAKADTGEVLSAFADLGEGLNRIGKAALDAAGLSKNEWKALGDTLAGLGIDDVTAKMLKMASTSDALGKALNTGNMNKIPGALEAAGVAIDLLRSKYEQVIAVAPEMGSEILTAMNVAQQGFDKGVVALQVLGDAHDRVKAKITGTTDATKQLGQEGGAALDGLKTQGGTALDTLNAALDKMGSTTNLRGLQQAIVQATTALDQLKTAGPSAGQSQADFGAKVKAAQDQIDASTKSLGGLKQTQVDVAATAKSSGSAMENLRSSAGNLDAMLMNMTKTGTGLEKGIGNVGLGLGIMGMAVQGAIATGDALVRAINFIADAYDKIEVKRQKQNQDIALEVQALSAVAAGHISMGKTMGDTIHNYELYAASTGRGKEAIDLLAKAFKDFGSAGTIEEANKHLADFAAVLSGKCKSGIEEMQAALPGLLKAAKANADEFTRQGDTIPADLQKVTKAIEQAIGAQKLLTEQGAKDAISSIQKIQAARNADMLDQEKSITHTQSTYNQQRKMLDDEALSDDAYSKKKRALYDEEVAALNVAYAKEAVIKEKAQEEEKNLQEKLNLSGSAFKDVEAAAASYGDAIKNGASPHDALRVAVGKLQQTIALMKEGILDDTLPAFKKLVDDALRPTNEVVGVTTQRMNELISSMRSGSDPVQALSQALLMQAAAMKAVSDNGKTLRDDMPQIIKAIQDLQKAADAAAGQGFYATGDVTP